MKNRTIIGLICIVLALVLAFGIAPMVNKFADNRTDVVRVTRDITQGHRLTEDDIAVISVGSYNLPAGVITDKTAVVGLYASCDMKKDDWFLLSKLNDTADSASDVFKSLDGKQVAISVTIPSFAGDLSPRGHFRQAEERRCGQPDRLAE